MSEVVPFPGAMPAPEVHIELDCKEVHAQAFRDMEGEVCDLDRMGEIACNLIMNCSAKEDGFHDLELATFAVWQLAKMAREFRANYQKRYSGELMGVL
jgi:hypothetical protein